MKRYRFIMTALMVAALLLAACGGGAEQNQTPGAGTLAPGDMGTMPAGDGAGLGTGTPAASDGMGAGTATTDAGAGVATTEATAAVGTTETAPAAEGTATAPATGDVTGTATVDAGTGSVPTTGAQFVLLSELTAMPVNDQSGSVVGSVSGVVVNSAAAAGASGMDAGTPAATTDASGAASTPAATMDASGAGATTQTPAAGGTGTGTAMGSNPSIDFVVVNVSGDASMQGGDAMADPDATTAATPGSDQTGTTETPAADATETSGSAGTDSGAMASSNQVLVPWQAFTFSGSASGDTSGMGDVTGTTTETPAAGATDSAGTAGMTTQTPAADTGTGTGATTGTNTGMQSGALTLNVDQSILASAPAFDATAFTGSVDSAVAEYWSGQGLSIPATGDSAAAGSSFLLRGPLTGLEVMDNGSQSLGQVSDFVVDTTTGELVYAVLSGGTTMGSDFYLVPMTSISWQQGGTSGMGQVSANFSGDAFSAAPSVSSLDELDLSSPDWQTEYDSYWSTVQ